MQPLALIVGNSAFALHLEQCATRQDIKWQDLRGAAGNKPQNRLRRHDTAVTHDAALERPSEKSASNSEGCFVGVQWQSAERIENGGIDKELAIANMTIAFPQFECFFYASRFLSEQPNVKSLEQ